MSSLGQGSCDTLQDTARPQLDAEVVVWVDEHGEQVRVEKNGDHTVTTTVQGNVS